MAESSKASQSFQVSGEKLWRAIGKMRVKGQMRVLEPRIVRDFLANPRRQTQLLRRFAQFDFCQDKTLMQAEVLINLPQKAVILDRVTQFFEDGVSAKLIEDEFGIHQGYFISKLGTNEISWTLDSNKRAFWRASDSYFGGSRRTGNAEIALPQAFCGLRQTSPFVGSNEVLALDFCSHSFNPLPNISHREDQRAFGT